MKFDIISLFPQAFNFEYSMVGAALIKQKVEIAVHDLRKYGLGVRRNVDEKPFGGGPGMVLMVEPLYRALKDLNVYPQRDPKTKVMLTSASGTQWNQKLAQSSAIELERCVIICGHYEGIDQRVADHLVDMEVSIGKYVLTGGELAASIIVDSVTRLLPGVLGNPESLAVESHNEVLETEDNVYHEYPQYTRPEKFVTDEGESWDVPSILLSGHHAEIEKWRNKKI
jgi:tRNA (guanine37-N1)-methyltransferase